MKQAIKRLLRRVGYDLVRSTDAGTAGAFPPDFDESTIALWRQVQPYTMTTRERVFALRRSVEYIVANDIPGAFVECGVWKGGSSMAMARTLLELGRFDRTLYLFDTFEGMPPSAVEDRAFDGRTADAFLEEFNRKQMLVSSLEDVKRAMSSTGYESGKMVFVPGRVEDTIPASAPETIALLRLDTDWYQSTYHELTHLYPRLAVGGVLLIDDYGHWQGARKAVDQYISEHKLKLLLCRIDYTGRICVKLDA
jgi:O-methyltransferase